MRQIVLSMLAALAVFSASAQDGCRWIDGASMHVYGKVVDSTASHYGRLPKSCEGLSREPVWQLGQNSAGLYLRFRTDAPEIKVKWATVGIAGMNHMALTGARGVDLYALEEDGIWRYVGVGRPNTAVRETVASLISGMECGLREYMLYLPLYDSVESLSIGVPENSVFEESSDPVGGQIVFYGTSITQGGCASRPGMCYTSIIGRHLGREVVNLGFSGNGRLDLEIAELMASMPAPSAYVLDYAGNAFVEDMVERDRKFFDILRSAHPDTPIIITGARYHILTRNNVYAYKSVAAKDERLQTFWSELMETGDENIWFVPSEEMSDASAEESVDGIHLTDLGMVHLAAVVENYLRIALE